MSENPYESDKLLSEYLLFHYGAPEQVLPHSFGPADALEFPVRCARDCVDAARLPERARALDLGCAVGRSAFELARHCSEVVGIDYSNRFIEVANRLREQGAAGSDYLVGARLSAADLYLANFIGMLDPLPPALNPMPEQMRSAYAYRTPALERALDDVLLEFRECMYQRHITTPLDF